MDHTKATALHYPRVWLYARTGSGHRSVAERQLKELREWATCNGYCVVGQSCECAKANSFWHPGLFSMLRAVRRGNVDTVAVTRLSRFAVHMSEKVAEYYNRFLGWSMEFGLATIERKRIIISQLYKRIELGRGYVVNFEVDWNYEQFIDALQMEKHKGMTEVGIPMPPKVKKRVTKNINRKSDGAA